MNLELVLQLSSLLFIVAAGPIVIGLLALRQGNDAVRVLNPSSNKISIHRLEKQRMHDSLGNQQ